MALAVQTKAPDFTVKYKNDEGLQDFSLSQNLEKGPVVILFFPLAFTSVCVGEMCSVRDSFSQYQSLKASVVGISVDSPFALEVMAKQDNLPFPLASDFNKDVAASYDVLYEDLLGFKGVAKRSAFVVGKDGTILFSWSSEDPHDLPDFEALKKAIPA